MKAYTHFAGMTCMRLRKEELKREHYIKFDGGWDNLRLQLVLAGRPRP